jgi:hypothetical protein
LCRTASPAHRATFSCCRDCTWGPLTCLVRDTKFHTTSEGMLHMTHKSPYRPLSEAESWVPSEEKSRSRVLLRACRRKGAQLPLTPSSRSS